MCLCCAEQRLKQAHAAEPQSTAVPWAKFYLKKTEAKTNNSNKNNNKKIPKYVWKPEMLAYSFLTRSITFDIFMCNFLRKLAQVKAKGQVGGNAIYNKKQPNRCLAKLWKTSLLRHLSQWAEHRWAEEDLTPILQLYSLYNSSVMHCALKPHQNKYLLLHKGARSSGYTLPIRGCWCFWNGIRLRLLFGTKVIPTVLMEIRR